MGTLGVHETLQERAQAREGVDGDVRGVDQLEGRAPFAGRHPFGDDRPGAVRQGTEEYPFASERGHALAVYGQ